MRMFITESIDDIKLTPKRSGGFGELVTTLETHSTMPSVALHAAIINQGRAADVFNNCKLVHGYLYV
jgi:hypothetical protein